jgi:hypothetical protein
VCDGARVFSKTAECAVMERTKVNLKFFSLRYDLLVAGR